MDAQNHRAHEEVTSDASGRRRLRVLGIPVDPVTMEQAMERFDRIRKAAGCSLIATPNSEIVILAGKNAELRRAIEEAELVIPDGIGLVYASRILGQPLKERVTGIDFLERALERLAAAGGSAYFLGGRPGVAEKAAAAMEARYPGLRIAGVRDGYFPDTEEENVIATINAAGADLLCVALGAPKQELFIQRNKERLRAAAAVGVGGSFDVFAGEVKRAPRFYREHGLEWLYRLVQQPVRIRRAAALPLFMVRVLLSRRGGRSHG